MRQRTIDMEEGSLQDKGKSRADLPQRASPRPILSRDTSHWHELRSLVRRSTSLPHITPPIASSSCHQDNIQTVRVPPSVEVQASINHESQLLVTDTRSTSHIASSSSHQDQSVPPAVEAQASSNHESVTNIRFTSHTAPLSTHKDNIIQGVPPLVEARASNNHESQLSVPATRSTSHAPSFSVIRTTPWRLLNTFFLLTAGIAKSISAYENASVAANFLDLVIGIFWALISYWFSVFEVEHPNIIPWLFKPAELDTVVVLLFFCYPPLMYLFFFLYIYGLDLIRSQDNTIYRVVYVALFNFITPILVLEINFAVFKIGRILYLKLQFISKLWDILGFQRDDWEISYNNLVSPFLGSAVFGIIYCVLLILSDDWVNSLDSVSSRAFGIFLIYVFCLFFTYIVIGFGRMAIRLAKKKYHDILQMD